MMKHEVISSLCALSTEVAKHIEKQTKECRPAADCFCGENPMSKIGLNFHFSKDVMEFIKTAVQEKMEKEKAKSSIDDLYVEIYNKVKALVKEERKISAMKSYHENYWPSLMALSNIISMMENPIYTDEDIIKSIRELENEKVKIIK